MATCDDRQLSEAQRQAGFEQNRAAGVIQAVRPFRGQPTNANIIDYLNRELYPAVRQTRGKVNDVYRQVTDNAPSGNPLGYYFSTNTANADPTSGYVRLNSATQDTATVLRVSQTNARLADVAPWLDVMSGGPTTPLGVVTLTDAVNPGRFLRFDLTAMVDVGAYWNLTISPIESSHDNPFVDGGLVVIGFIPGVGGTTAATVPATAISGALGPRQFLSSTTSTPVDFHSLSSIFPGAPIYDVMAYPFNATGSLAGDDTSAINAAIAAANAAPGVIYLGPAHRITAALTPITGNNVRLIGRGEFNGGTILQVDSASAVNAVTVSGCQYSSVERLWIVGTRVFSSGFGLRFQGTYRCYSDRVVISSMCFGVETLDCTLTEIRRTHLGDLYGIYGFLARGSGGSFNHAVRYEACVCGTDFPATVVGTATVWATATAYVVGNIVFANGNIYQAVQAGTSGASAPSGSGTTASNAHTTQITDGTVKWVYAMSLTIWFCQESGSQTFEIVDCGTLQGGYGLLIADSTGSVPLFCRVQNFQVDHPFTAGIQLDAGGAIRMNQVFITSVLEGSGIIIGSGVSGNWEFVGGEIFGCNKAGITIAKGDGLLDGLQIGACGLISSNTRDCIEVAASVTRFRITGCSGGAMFGSTSPATRYGLSIAAGSDSYEVVGNVFSGNLTGGILNTPGRASTRVVLNNVPDLTITPGSTWGLQVDAAGAAVPIEITGLEQGENLRRETFVVTTSTGTVTTFAIANITTQVVCKSTSALIIRGMTATAATFGKTIEFSMHAGFAGTVTFNNEDGSAAASLERIACPENTNLTLTAGQVAVLTYFDSRWRVVAVSRAAVVGVTDGDKGDIVVSSTGTVWTIDTNVVGNTKLRQGVAHSVIGRSANSTGDVADIASTSGGQVLRQGDSSNTLVFATVSTLGIADGAVTDAKLRDGQGDSVIGRSVNSTGAVADIVCTAGSFGVLRENGSGTIAWGTITGSNITDAAVTLAKQANLAQSRVIGRASGAGTGVPTALTPTQLADIFSAEDITWNGVQKFNSRFQFINIVSSASTAINNGAIGSANVYRLTACTSLTGMVAADSGQFVLIINASSGTLNIEKESASSSASNRFVGASGSALSVGPGQMGIAWYDGGSGRWAAIVGV